MVWADHRARGERGARRVIYRWGRTERVVAAVVAMLVVLTLVVAFRGP